MNFDNWQCNAPSVELHRTSRPRARVTYYSENSFGERLLVLLQSKSGTLHTWSYRFETNSWGIVETEDKSLPPIRYNETGSVLVTVCQSTILYIAGHREFNSFVWRFDGYSEVWSRRPVAGDTVPQITEDENSLYFPLFDKTAQLSTSCECCHAVVGFSMAMNVVWKLSCSDVKTQQQFVWEELKAGYNGTKTLLSEAKFFYPSNVYYNTARAGTEEGIILVMADHGLWKYDLYVNQWFSLDSRFDPRKREIHSTFSLRAFFSSKERVYTVFSVDNKDNEIKLYSLSKRTWNSTKFLRDSKPSLLGFFIIVNTAGSSRLLYLATGLSKDCNPSLWELQGKLGSTWKWNETDSWTISPFSACKGERVAAVSQTHADNLLYVLVTKTTSHGLVQKLQLWELQLNTMSWVLLHVFGNTEGMRYQESRRTIVFYGSIVISFLVPNCSLILQLKAYNTKKMSWTLDKQSLIKILQERRDFCVAPVNSSSLLLYGGVSELDPYRFFCDLWIVMLRSPSSSRLQWFQLQPDCEDQDQRNS